MSEEKMIEIKYKLTPEILEIGSREHYDFRHANRKWCFLLAGVFLICLGAIGYSKDSSLGSQFLNIFFVVMGVLYLFNKSFYVRRSIKSAFAGRPREICLLFKVRENDYHMRADDSEFTAKWSSIINYHFFDKGILLYPQKNMFYYIPYENSEISGGSWDEVRALIERNVKITV